MLIVARRVRPVLILPIRYEPVLTQGIGPVVPCFAKRNGVERAIVASWKLRHNGVCESVDRLLPEHRAVNVASHVGLLVLVTFKL